MKPEEIIVGEFYETCDGDKARIYAKDGKGVRPVHGAVYCRDDDAWTPISWTANGDFFPNNRGSSPVDLIRKWVDKPAWPWDKLPKCANWAAIDFDGRAFWYETRPEAQNYAFYNQGGRGGLIYPDHIPQWDGDWRESLVVRPGYKEDAA